MFTLSNIKKKQVEVSEGKLLWFKNFKRQKLFFHNNTILKIENIYYFENISYVVIYNPLSLYNLSI